MKKGILVLMLVCGLGQVLSGQLSDTTTNWTLKTKLPLIVIERINPEVKDVRFRFEYGTIRYHDSIVKKRNGERILDKSEAEKTSRDFIKRYYPSFSDTLVLGSIVFNEGSWPPKVDEDSLIIVTFYSRWHGMNIYDSGINVYLLGSRIENATFNLWKVTSIVPNSERTLISKKKAIEIWKRNLKQKKEPEFTELQFYYFPRDNENYDSNKYVLRPQWIFEDEIVVDAFTGKIWRND